MMWLAQSLNNDQLHSVMRGFGTLTFIAAVFVAALVMLLTLLIARRVARKVKRQIEEELALRSATRSDSVWSAAGERIEVERDDADEDEDEEEGEDWRPESDPKSPREW